MHCIHTILSLLAAGLLSVTAVTAPAAASDASLPAPPRTLVFLNWSEYIDPELVEEFEQQFNAKVSEVYFESDDLRDDMMLETGAAGYDLVIVNGINVDSYRKRGWIAPLDEAAMPNLKYVDTHWRNAFDSGNGYGVPYFWGTLGIAYRKDLVEQPPSSWMDVLQPAETLRGKIGMIENSRDLLGMALKALGHSANSTDPTAVKAAEQLLLAQKPYVKTYNYLALTEESALVSGDIVAAMVYSGDALMVQEHDENIQYVLPAEGGNIWVDYLAVVENSRNKDLAWAFINFLNEPEHAAQLAEYVYYATPNTAAEKLLPQEFLADPVIYPGKEALARSEFHAPLPPRAVKKRNLAFARVRQ
jgi:spermidine/putrescine transport system substrate-binding protein